LVFLNEERGRKQHERISQSGKCEILGEKGKAETWMDIRTCSLPSPHESPIRKVSPSTLFSWQVATHASRVGEGRDGEWEREGEGGRRDCDCSSQHPSPHCSLLLALSVLN